MSFLPKYLEVYHHVSKVNSDYKVFGFISLRIVCGLMTSLFLDCIIDVY